MAEWTKPITDRTQSDIINKTDKAFLNYEHLNEIANNIIFLRDKLNNEGYKIYANVKNDWTMYDYPTYSEMQKFIISLNNIRNGFIITSSDIPDNFNNLTFQKLNNIEKFLEDINKLIDNMKSEYKYCGQEICGGE